jgi:hypothetical protein
LSYDHVVLISVDTLRSDGITRNPLRLWPHKYPNLKPPDTTVLDDLTRQGAFFANCVSAAPYTSSAHATILTGKWPVRHGVYEFFNRKLGTGTLFNRAQRAGYGTVVKSDFPLILGPTLGFDRGVDRFIVEDDEAYLESITALPRSVSLVHFGGVHVPYGFHNLRYGGEAYRSKLAELEADLGEPQELPKDQLFETYRDEEDLLHLMRYKRVIQELWQRGRPDEIFGLYLEGIEHFLRSRFAPFLERLLAALAGKRWLIVLFGDHGEEYDEDSFGHFNSVAEGVLRVPLLFLGEDVTPAIHTERVRTADIFPTLAELMDDRAARRLRLDGVSLAATVRDRRPYPVLPGYAQAYVADTATFIRFQRRLMLEGSKRGSLPHLLCRETVWDREYKLTRHLADFNDYLSALGPIDPVEKLERFDADQVPRAVEEPAVADRLRQMLAKYNALKAPARPATATTGG